MEEIETDIIIYDSKGPSGNIFSLLGIAGAILKRQCRNADYNELWEKVTHSQSYEEAVGHIGEYVGIVDIQSVKSKKDMEME